MVQAGSFDSDQNLVWPQGSEVLHPDFKHLRTAGAKHTGNAALMRSIHDESPYH
jgi:hypothetical protein